MKKAKIKSKYICNECGYETLKWLGRCPECESWNSFVEEVQETGRKQTAEYKGEVRAFTFDEIEQSDEDRINTGIEEFDRVLGGGFIPGSIVLVGGEPGIGKSTLMLQAAAKIKTSVLYITGEESIQQIKMRSKRLDVKSQSIKILAETSLSKILTAINQIKPDVVAIDSIQTIYDEDLDNSPGTVTQIRECASRIMSEAKQKNFTAVVIGHVTKEGVIAGPKILEHMVDTVIQIEGESGGSFRIVRALKNRFGSTNEIGVFEMRGTGLTEVKNPSELFIGERKKSNSGSAVTASMEGTRSILIEVQALVTPSYYGTPQRVATGFDYRRLSILLAVLEKRAGHRLSSHDVFLKIAGGVRIDEPAIDLAVCTAVVSSLQNKAMDASTVVMGEVGLGGELRSISNTDKRVQECVKLGFSKIIMPQSKGNSAVKSKGTEIITASNLVQALQIVLP